MTEFVIVTLKATFNIKLIVKFNFNCLKIICKIGCYVVNFE